MPHTQIDERYFDSSYYVTPNDEVGQDAFAVIRDAMRGKGMVALGRVVLAKRERVIMLQPWDKGLMGTTLRYAYEVRNAKDYFDEIPEIKVPGEMLKLAEHILDTKKDDFDPAAFVDHYEEAVVKMLQKKQAGVIVPKASGAQAAPKNVINLMDALRRSVESGKTQKPARARRPGGEASPKKSKRARSRASARCCCRSRARRRTPPKEVGEAGGAARARANARSPCTATCRFSTQDICAPHGPRRFRIASAVHSRRAGLSAAQSGPLWTLSPEGRTAGQSFTTNCRPRIAGALICRALAKANWQRRSCRSLSPAPSGRDHRNRSL